MPWLSRPQEAWGRCPVLSNATPNLDVLAMRLIICPRSWLTCILFFPAPVLLRCEVPSIPRSLTN
eukprot:887436-Pyramimonas_sp.AAC.1